MPLTLKEHKAWLQAQLQRAQTIMRDIDVEASQSCINLSEVYNYYHGMENAYVNALNNIRFNTED